MHAMTSRRGAATTLASALLLALIAACSTTPPEGGGKDGAPVESRNAFGGGSAGGDASRTASAAQSQVATVALGEAGAAGGAGAGGDAAAMAQGRIVYFDFDSYTVKDEYRPLIERHARLLVANAKRHLVVEGHTDERGGHEYNLALGQKRAAEVVKSLTLLGAAESQLEPVSFGAERPADAGHDEAAWAKNRRAELKER